MTICLGLITIIFLGGVLNFLEIAYAATLNMIVLTGIAMGVGFLDVIWERRLVKKWVITNSFTKVNFLRVCPGAFLILAAFLFQASFLTPPAAFNIHDDFETYLSLPLRMLETGTLQPGIFSNFGVNTLGAQAYLHGLVATHWPVGYVDAVDSLFGLALTGTLILIICQRVNLSAWLTLLAIAAVISINPQYVNISTLYIGSALLIFLLFLHLGIRDDGSSLEQTSTTSAIATGMIYATLVALKPTFFLVVLTHFTLTTIAVIFAKRNFRLSATWVFYIVVSGFFCALPWVMNQAYKFLPAVFTREPTAAKPISDSHVAETVKSLDFFSTDPFIYGFGTSHVHYTALIGLALLCSLILAFRAYSNRQLSNPGILFSIAGCLTLPTFFTVHMLIIGGMIMGYDTALRYAAPALIGIVPAAIVLSGSSLTACQNPKISIPMRHLITTAALGIPTAFIIFSFLDSVSNRARQAMEYNTALSFLYFSQPGPKKGYIQYNNKTFSQFTRERFLKIQNQVPSGDALLSYISSSMHFDYSRNRILNVDAGGLDSFWLDFPLDGSTDDAAKFLLERDVNYILWEYRGYAVPTTQTLRNTANFPSSSDRRRAKIKLKFTRLLKNLSERSEVLHDDSSYRLFRLHQDDR